MFNGKVPKDEFETIAPRANVSAMSVSTFVQQLRESMYAHLTQTGATEEVELAYIEGYLQGIAACFETVQVSVSKMDPIISPMVAQSFHGHASFIIAVAQRLRAQRKK